MSGEHWLYPWQACGCDQVHRLVDVDVHVTADECGCALAHQAPTEEQPEPPAIAAPDCCEDPIG